MKNVNAKHKASKAKKTAHNPREVLGAKHASKRALAGDVAVAAEREYDMMHASERPMDTVAAAVKSAVKDVKEAPADGHRYRPAAAVATLVHDAKSLVGVAERVGKKLVAGGLDPLHLEELPKRIALVSAAQRAWEKQREHTTPLALRSAREKAAALKTDMLAAGRYLMRNDAVAQRELDRIAEGDGIGDLVSDLRALAEFYEHHVEELKNADVPAKATQMARDLAVQLAVSLAQPLDEKAHEAQQKRNRAVAMLDETVHEIRAAGRYVFRTMPARLAMFAVEMRRARAGSH